MRFGLTMIVLLASCSPLENECTLAPQLTPGMQRVLREPVNLVTGTYEPVEARSRALRAAIGADARHLHPGGISRRACTATTLAATAAERAESLRREMGIERAREAAVAAGRVRLATALGAAVAAERHWRVRLDTLGATVVPTGMKPL